MIEGSGPYVWHEGTGTYLLADECRLVEWEEIPDDLR